MTTRIKKYIGINGRTFYKAQRRIFLFFWTETFNNKYGSESFASTNRDDTNDFLIKYRGK